MKRIVNDVIDFVKDNQNRLEKIKQEDSEVFAFGFDVDKLIEVLTNYKNETRKQESTKKIFVSHYGNPYITAMLCLEAIMHQTELVIGIEDICYGLNSAIVKIVNDIVKEYKIHTKISLKMNPSNNDIEAMSLEQCICLGNSNAYTQFRKLKNVETKYVPLFDVAVYYDAEEYEELAEDIRYFAYQNLYEIEIFDETEELEDVIYSINHSLTKQCAVILSKNKEKQEEFKQEINSKIICVNENPFKKFELKILEEIF